LSFVEIQAIGSVLIGCLDLLDRFGYRLLS